jgi:hypothetical protein
MEAIMTAVTKMRTDEVALRKACMLIGGKWIDSASGEVLEIEDPAHRRPIAEVPRGGAEDVARAVHAKANPGKINIASGLSRDIGFVFVTGYDDHGLFLYRDRPTLKKPFQKCRRR